MRTRKERKGYLRGDSGGQPGADPPDSLELVGSAKRTQGITVGDNSRRQRRPDTSKRLDFSRGSDVEVDDAGNRWPAIGTCSGRVEFRTPDVHRPVP